MQLMLKFDNLQSMDVTDYTNGFMQYRIYVDIIKEENCRQFKLLTWTSFIGQQKGSVWDKEGMGGLLFQPASSFPLLEYMII